MRYLSPYLRYTPQRPRLYLYSLHCAKLTWQWNVDLLKMYSLLKIGKFHCCVSLLKVIIYIWSIYSIWIGSGTPLYPLSFYWYKHIYTYIYMRRKCLPFYNSRCTERLESIVQLKMSFCAVNWNPVQTVLLNNTVDRRNPAPPGMCKTL